MSVTYVQLRLRPLPVRLYRHYKAYRGIGMSAVQAIRMSWLVSTGRVLRKRPR